MGLPTWHYMELHEKEAARNEALETKLRIIAKATEVKDNLNTFFCSECGSPVYNDMSPSYCPYCGARVVERGDA